MVVRIVMVRHGQTEWNKEERFRGLIDVPLNETGLWQAEQAAKLVKSRYEVSAIYSSAVGRAMKTAEAVGRAVGVTPQPLQGIIDLSFGDWEGKSLEDVAREYPREWELWRTAPNKLSIPGGESLAGVRRRASAAVEELARVHTDETIVVVSHRVVCKILALYFLGLTNSSFWKLDVDTTSVSLFERRKSGWITLLLNDTSHLDK